MCGIVGMFVGCSALSYCPRSLLAGQGQASADGERTAEAEAEYRSPFSSWHERAAVRQAPRRLLDDGTGNRHYFSPDLVPLARHPLVSNLPDDVFEDVLIQHLHRYLDFTAMC